MSYQHKDKRRRVDATPLGWEEPAPAVEQSAVATRALVYQQDDGESPMDAEVHGGPQVSSNKGALLPPVEFPFPFQPYDIQKGFMRELYSSIEQGGLGIFESPTGTGKSMSLLCGALKWLEDNDARSNGMGGLEIDIAPEDPDIAVGTEKAPAWVLEQSMRSRSEEIEEQKSLLRDRIQAQNDRISRAKASLADSTSRRQSYSSRRRALSSMKSTSNHSSTAKPDDDGSDDEAFLLDDMPVESDSDDEQEKETDVSVVKILFCSRTHSQIAQLVQEAKRTPYGDRVKVVTLGSRQTLCVNPEVNKACCVRLMHVCKFHRSLQSQLSSLTLINEKCLDLAKKTTDSVKKTKGCSFKKPAALTQFRDLSLASVHDIEEALDLGTELHACPYYASRQAIAAAQIVAMPYNILLHKETREAVGVPIKGNIVVIDEAHNLLETISNIHSVFVSQAIISRAQAELKAYEDKYKTRLKACNLVYIQMILKLLKKISLYFHELSSPDQKPEAFMLHVNNFLHKTNTDNINLFKLLEFCEKTELSKKLNGFVLKFEPTVTARSKGSEFVSKHSSALRSVEPFLKALTNADENGRIVVTTGGTSNHNGLKFLLLNPSLYFHDILAEARVVIVAGGTMSPISEFAHQLLSEAKVTPKVHVYTCDHIVPSCNLHPCVIKTGPGGVPLNFSFKNRSNGAMDLGMLIRNICSVVPGGVVVFFPSYDYETQVFRWWQKNGIVDKLEEQKTVFHEARDESADRLLAEYSKCIESGKGALMMSVVGGKLSEGINFKDDLGRCVVMVGMPFPNKESPELKEKLGYLRRHSGDRAAEEHYENMCMKAVNQSIGRAIRHKGDYAAIVLADERYAKHENMKSKLPGWILKHLECHDQYHTVHRPLTKFFKSKRSVASEAQTDTCTPGL